MKAPAWIISITDTVSVAVGEFELVHILPDNPKLFSLPQAPHYCQQVFVWQNKIIPLMNLAEKFGLEKNSTTGEQFAVSIFAYRTEKTGQPEYGALLSNAIPHRCEVSDKQACQLPTELYLWRHYVRCCFQDTDTQKVIPILKLDRLFAYQDVTN
jgi:chemotaxis signal transduction protein